VGDKLLIDLYVFSVKLQQYLVSEWVLFNATSTIFQLYHGDNKLIFNGMMMKSDLC
jgi:hypothetical protein